MRTTVNLDADVLAAARSLAHQEGVSLGAAISKLARRGLGGSEAGRRQSEDRLNLPSFEVRENTPPFGNEDVRSAIEEE